MSRTLCNAISFLRKEGDREVVEVGFGKRSDNQMSDIRRSRTCFLASVSR